MSRSVKDWKRWLVVVAGCFCVISVVFALAHWFWPRQPKFSHRQALSHAEPPRSVRLPLSIEPAPAENLSEKTDLAGRSVPTLLAQNPNASPTVNATSSAKNSAAASPTPVPQASAVSTGSARSLADLLNSNTDLSDPAQRARVVEQTRAIEMRQKVEANAKADKLGIPKRIKRPDGTVMELMRFEGDQPVYFITHNANAAISTGANLLRLAPYAVDGAGVTVGIWDGGAVRSTHQEFGGARVTIKD